jgi:hypothetical protein
VGEQRLGQGHPDNEDPIETGSTWGPVTRCTVDASATSEIAGQLVAVYVVKAELSGLRRAVTTC